MKYLLHRRPSPALVIACIALFVSLGGVSYGVATGFIDSREIANNTIRSKDIRNGAILTQDIRNNEVRGFDIRNSSIQGRDVAFNTLTGVDIEESSLGKVPAAASADSAAALSSLKTFAPTTLAEGATPVTVSVRRDGDDAVLEVADRGPGVPPEMRERIFERFARGGGDTTRSGGSGLGLAIVRAVADAHGGRVELLDAPGGGSRFVVRLPATSRAPVRSDGAASVFRS